MPVGCNSVVSANASNGLPVTWALTPAKSGNVIVSTAQSEKDTALTLDGRDYNTPAGANITGTETETQFAAGGQVFLIEARFSDAARTGAITVEITCRGAAESMPTPAPTVFVADSGFGADGGDGSLPLSETELQTQATFQEFLAITQNGDLNQTVDLTITVRTEVDGRTINRRVPKSIRRDASYVDIVFFTDSTCTQALQYPGANGSLAHYTEQHSYHNSPINMPERDIGPPYGVFCSGYAPVGQFRRESCTLADVSAKRDGCIQLINPLSGKYWYDTAFAACKNPRACDSRKIDIVSQAEQVKDVILEARAWLMTATITQGIAIFIAVFLHFVFETLMGGNVFGHVITWFFFIIKNLMVFISFVANVHLGRYLTIATIDGGETVTEWLDNFIENECFDAQGTVVLTETRSFVIDTATQMVVIGLIILIDALIEDNISIVIEGTRANKDEVKEAVEAIYQRNETLRQSIKHRPGLRPESMLPKKKIVPAESNEPADSERDATNIVMNAAFDSALGSSVARQSPSVAADDAATLMHDDGYLNVAAVDADPSDEAGTIAVGVTGTAKNAGMSADALEQVALDKKRKQDAAMARRKAEPRAKQVATKQATTESIANAKSGIGTPVPTTAETQFVDERPYYGDSGAPVVGDRVSVVGKGVGTVVFIGPHHISGEDRLGVNLDEPNGINDGTVSGHKYFDCKPLHGVLTVPERVTALLEDVYENLQAAAPTPPPKISCSSNHNTAQEQPRSTTAASQGQQLLDANDVGAVDVDLTATRITAFKPRNAAEEPHDYENSDAIVPGPDTKVVLRIKKEARDGAAADDNGTKRKTLWSEARARTASMGPKAKNQHGESGNDRCPKCAAKLAFCICNDGETRRQTMNNPIAAADAKKAEKKATRRRRSKGPTCSYVNDEGRTCNKPAAEGKPQCPNHACQMPTCTVGKSSRADFCDQHMESGI